MKLKPTDHGHKRYDPSHIPGRLTEYDKEEIRAAAKAGSKPAALAQAYKREVVTIRRILGEKL